MSGSGETYVWKHDQVSAHEAAAAEAKLRVEQAEDGGKPCGPTADDQACLEAATKRVEGLRLASRPLGQMVEVELPPEDQAAEA